jgi:inner membrane protein
VRPPLFLRVIAVAGVAIAILVPISLIKDKIAERQARADQVVRQFADETSGAQLVVGPLLAVTCEETYTEERQVMRAGKAETVAETKTASCPTAYFPPRTFSASATVPVEQRHRGIYTIRMFRTQVEMAGEFRWPAPPVPLAASRPRAWKHVYAAYFVSDPRGIQGFAGGGFRVLEGGEPGVDLTQFTIREDLGDYGDRAAGAAVPFAAKLTLAGTSSLAIAPVGDENDIRIDSTWPHPSFLAAWSPNQQDVTSAGFTAAWRVTSMATGGQPAWNLLASTPGKLATSKAAGVALFDPINVYALSYRATEYAFLFVLFTFAALALAEAMANVTLHPVQHALVGSAVAVFFLLLIALSEHFAFALSYAAGAAACILLLTYYLRHPLGNARRTAVFFAIFAGLYGALYLLLQSEDNALLAGSLMVFALLAFAMIATRRKDWSVLGRTTVTAATAPGDD